MDARFLDYYNRELTYLRELGGEFAQAFPKVAARLGGQGEAIADPYVERLMEGFSFLAARIHLKIDAEFPRFSQRLLEVVYPHYLAPTPAMAIVRLEAGATSGKELPEGARVPRGTRMNSGLVPGTKTQCTFVTAHDLEVWPIEIVEARAGTPGDDLPSARLPGNAPVRGVIRIRMRRLPGGESECRQPDRIVLYIAADEPQATLLHEAIVGHGRAVVVSGVGPGSGATVLEQSAIRAEGYAADQALLPCDARVFQGYRLLHEYFAFPQRFLFFSLNGLSPALERIAGDSFDLNILLDRDVGALAASVSRKSLALNCVPVINLFQQNGARLPTSPGEVEQHIVPDRTRPLDFEVYRVDAVEGLNRGNEAVRRFAPFYHYVGQESGASEAYFSVRREPRRISEASNRGGGRSAYLGSEVYLSLVDPNEAPWSETIEQLSLDMLVTNRDLPLLLPSGEGAVLAVETDVPLRRASIVCGPSRPRNPVAERDMTWRLISHLSLNYLALSEMDAASGAGQLRELLGLYAALADPVVARHADAIVSADVQAVNRRLPVSGPLVFGRGVAVNLTLDERPFAGGSPYLFGSVLEQFLARHVSMNMFCEVAITSTTRGALASWPPRWGGRPDA